jgi:AraC-like DNA-binding protein
MTPVRTFPIRLPPLAGEALDSWLEALAHRMHTCIGDLLAGAGVASRSDRTLLQAKGALDRTILLGPDEAAGIAAVTGIPRSDVEAMTLARYDGTALRIDRPNRTINRHHLWGRGAGSRYCPQCLASSGGRWLLVWRLGWCFACPAHRQLLADTCPACGQAQRQRPLASHVIPHPGRCGHPAFGGSGRAAPRCSADLTGAVTAGFPDGHPMLAAQQLLLEVISSGIAAFGVYASEPQPARVALADVQALASRILTYATADDLAAILPADLLASYHNASAEMQHPRSRPGFMAPRSAAVAAAGVTAAMTVLGESGIPAAGAALRWLAERSRHRGVTVSPTAITSRGGGISAALTAVQLSALDPLLSPGDRLRYRTTVGNPRRPLSGTRITEHRARYTPSLFWPELSLHFALPRCHLQHLRATLSCALLTAGTRVPRSQAVHRLGMAAYERRVSSRTLQLLAADPHWPQILTGITRISDYLDTHNAPIDYQRRRELCYEDLLPDDAWSLLCRRTGTPTGTRKAAVARSVLFERISGLPAGRAPFAVDSDAFRASVASFPAHLTPEFAAGLHDAAQIFLNHHGIRDEPVSWHPPLTLLSGLELPGPDLSRVEITEVHQVIRQGQATLQETAEQLGTTIGAIRYLLEEHPAPTSPRARGQVRAATRMALPKNELAELYLNQRLSLHEIGRRVGASSQTVSRLAHEYGISPRKGRSPRTVIDRAWLYEQYVTRRRTLNDLACETGMNRTTMNRRAHSLGIPIRGGGGPSHQQNLHALDEAMAAPAILRPALQEKGGWQRLQRFAAVAAHATIWAAEDALGLKQSVLTHQIKRLERDLDGQLLIRAQRGHPMKLTAFGAEVVSAIAQVKP